MGQQPLVLPINLEGCHWFRPLLSHGAEGHLLSLTPELGPGENQTGTVCTIESSYVPFRNFCALLVSFVNLLPLQMSVQSFGGSPWGTESTKSWLHDELVSTECSDPPGRHSLTQRPFCSSSCSVCTWYSYRCVYASSCKRYYPVWLSMPSDGLPATPEVLFFLVFTPAFRWPSILLSGHCRGHLTGLSDSLCLPSTQ